MRLFILLAAALVATAAYKRHGGRLILPKGLPDGALVTFRFYHHGRAEGFTIPKCPVDINFYDVATFEKDTSYDIIAHIRIDRDYEHPVASNTYTSGRWLTESLPTQQLDRRPPHTGYWRVDVYKHDAYRMNVFFQGFWSGVREFELSLNTVRSIWISSEFIGEEGIERMDLRLPNKNIAPISVDEANRYMSAPPVNYRKLIQLPNFPIGAHINISAVMCGHEGGIKPTLLFAPLDSTTFFMKIVQYWGGPTDNIGVYRTHELYITSGDNPQPDNSNRRSSVDSNQCTDWHNGENGDLVHLTVERISRDLVKMRVHYNNVSCRVIIPLDLVKYLDRPFDIISLDGALILHLEHSIPPVTKSN